VGNARARGTYEERKAQAVEREPIFAATRAEVDKRKKLALMQFVMPASDLLAQQASQRITRVTPKQKQRARKRERARIRKALKAKEA
jgi:hypothetical protein